jgi:AcrR family transcriptional regulator
MVRQAYAKGILRREAILESAMQEIAGGPFRRRSLREICLAIDVEPAHVVYYFGSRDGLLRAVVERWDSDTVAASEVDADPLRPLDFFVEHVRLNSLVPGLLHLYLTLAIEAGTPDHPSHHFIGERFVRAGTLLAGSIEIEQQGGLIPRDVDPSTAGAHLAALADGLQIRALADPTVIASDELGRAVVNLRSAAHDPEVVPLDDATSALAGIRLRLANGTSGV